jgi:hypothetical protein
MNYTVEYEVRIVGIELSPECKEVIARMVELGREKYQLILDEMERRDGPINPVCKSQILTLLKQKNMEIKFLVQSHSER